MWKQWKTWLCTLVAGAVWLAGPASAQAQGSAAAPASAGLQGHLASVAWLQAHLGRPDVLVLDASPTPQHRKGHIPGAVNADLFPYATHAGMAGMEKRFQSWGVDPGLSTVIVDEGGTYQAARLFWDMVQHGLPAQRLFILDGGMAKWREAGAAVTQEATPPRTPSTVRLSALNPDVRVYLPEFLAATANPARHVMLEALDPDYFYGGAGFFNRPGHVPHATLMPSDDLFNADKTFKSPAEMRRMFQHLGVKPDREVLTYCGGGGAAAVPFFALKYLLGYPEVKMFQESQRGWLQDERQLPVWTYGAPYLVRDTAWLKTWGSPFARRFGLAQVGVLDVRSAEAFKLGHVPLAQHLAAPELAKHLHQPDQLAAMLSRAGLQGHEEAVVVAEGGLTEAAALAFLVLDSLGQQRLSMQFDSIERWADAGLDIARPAAVTTPAGGATGPAAPKPYAARPRQGVLVSGALRTEGNFSKVYIRSGTPGNASPLPAGAPAGRVIELAAAQFLAADGMPKPAKDIWKTMEKAGVPRYAELVFVADTPQALGPSAVNYFIFKLMGFADIKVWAPT
jgi:thiosulfate/3-mercaptopyruvate sulfurtransferase